MAGVTVRAAYWQPKTGVGICLLQTPFALRNPGYATLCLDFQNLLVAVGEVAQ